MRHQCGSGAASRGSRVRATSTSSRQWDQVLLMTHPFLVPSVPRGKTSLVNGGEMMQGDFSLKTLRTSLGPEQANKWEKALP